MTAPTGLPWGRALTRADLDAMPDDGHRYELVDGVLVVTPAPSWRHQAVVVSLAVALRTARPDRGWEVLVAPVDVALDAGTVLQPDVLVTRLDDLSDRGLAVAPVLAVEVLSPSTRRVDLTLKRGRYEAAGTPSYWVVDPDEPSLTAWALAGGRYVRTTHVTGTQQLHAFRPYDLT